MASAKASDDRPILLTGVAGFIGFHVAKRLLDDGRPVVGIDNLNPYYDVTLKEARLRQLKGLPGFGFHRIDLADQLAMVGHRSGAEASGDLGPAVGIDVADCHKIGLFEIGIVLGMPAAEIAGADHRDSGFPHSFS